MNTEQKEVNFKVKIDQEYFTKNIVDLMNTHGTPEYLILLDKFIEKTIDIEVHSIEEVNVPDLRTTEIINTDNCLITIY